MYIQCNPGLDTHRWMPPTWPDLADQSPLLPSHALLVPSPIHSLMLPVCEKFPGPSQSDPNKAVQTL
jgi:hypothetical protein